MHYLTYVFIPDNTNIKEAVAGAMRPHGEAFEVQPWKRHLDDGEIAAMAEHYSVSRIDLPTLAGRMESWNGGTGGVDENGLFAVLAYNPNATWDWYEIGGRWDGLLRSNNVQARTLLRSRKLRDRLPHDFLTPDGAWHAKAKYVSTGWCQGHMVHTAERRWLQEFRSALSAWPKHRVVVVDRHC